MAYELRNDTADMHQLLWNNWTVLKEEENVSLLNTTNTMDRFFLFNTLGYWVIMAVLILIDLCGLVGNGIVIWLLGFRMKRNHFSVYILNLAIADFTYLSFVGLHMLSFYIFIHPLMNIVETFTFCSYIVSLSLLMTISIDRCVSVLWPIWYKCRRPAHLSTIVCAVVWVLFFISVLILCSYLNGLTIWFIYDFISLPTFLVLFVSSLTLFIRVQCYCQQRKPSRLYWTILLNVLAFLLLSVPRGVYLVCIIFIGLPFQSSEISIFTILLCVMNSAVNPIIYFFIGRHRQWEGKTPLGEVLQRALTDENEEVEQRRGRTSPPDRA
ncbi:LOW QUALITY PROTEIN: mas-related G-protein coupled receptor member X1-like [Suncus etruscus]|uniref:LOW QUALITY PROTEIN: mas-related G-protein coupled receptor member X1-like n=1 Tax=Suncus etruscus TaxID=109475 RepID=UPI002110AD3F|nr:LOW QUALITY PROTEIN: mas-related G-protein coupled receptor member X1-like [Suncus etruscus]